MKPKTKEEPILALAQFIPDRTFDLVAPYFSKYKIHLTLKQERKRVFGDYRNPIPSQPYHKISVNGNLNKYSFLVTLLHELAHLETYVQYKHTVDPHGKEWKNKFKAILIPFLEQNLFPEDIKNALISYINNIKASTCGDINLYKALHQYDNKPSHVFLDTLPERTKFRTDDGQIFLKLEKLRTRYKCQNLGNNRMYSFPAIAQVQPISNNDILL